MNVSIIVAYYGDRDHWAQVAQPALRSAENQTVPAQVVEQYGPTLHEARNAGAAAATGDHLIFLDADDQLDARYVEAMLTGTADLRQPATLGVYPDGTEDPAAVVIPPKPLLEGNFMVIGTMVDHRLFDQVGGFKSFEVAEDWELWIRCWLAGATIEAIPEAVYRVSVNPAGRNAAPHQVQLRVWNRVRQLHTAAAVAKGLA